MADRNPEPSGADVTTRSRVLGLDIKGPEKPISPVDVFLFHPFQRLGTLTTSPNHDGPEERGSRPVDVSVEHGVRQGQCLRIGDLVMDPTTDVSEDSVQGALGARHEWNDGGGTRVRMHHNPG